MVRESRRSPSATAHIEHLRDVNLFFDFPIHQESEMARSLACTHWYAPKGLDTADIVREVIFSRQVMEILIDSPVTFASC